MGGGLGTFIVEKKLVVLEDEEDQKNVVLAGMAAGIGTRAFVLSCSRVVFTLQSQSL